MLAGGRARPDVGPLFHEPTVLADVPRSARCASARRPSGRWCRCTWSASDDEAVALANDTAYGLNANVWTRDTARGRRIAARIEAGTVSVNETYLATWGSVAAPMGGHEARAGSAVGTGARASRGSPRCRRSTVQHGTRFGVGLGRMVDLPSGHLDAGRSRCCSGR